MITCNGIIGLAILTAALRERVARFNAEGSATAFATVITLATLSLVLPTFTTSKTGPEFSASQLAFAAVASLALYVLFLIVQTVRHRGHFLPEGEDGERRRREPHGHRRRHRARAALRSLGLLLVSLVAVVGLAKTSSGAIEEGVKSIGAPQSAVGVVIALLVLMPETLAAWRTARRGRVQISFNLGYGSAMASIGLTIPVIAIASIWLDGPLVLGLGSTQIVPPRPHRAGQLADPAAGTGHPAGGRHPPDHARRLPLPRLQSLAGRVRGSPKYGSQPVSPSLVIAAICSLSNSRTKIPPARQTGACGSAM